MVAACGVRFESCLDVAQTPGFAELSKKQREQQLAGGQSANAFVGVARLDNAAEDALGEPVGQLAKDSIVVRHGAGLLMSDWSETHRP